MTKFQSPKGTKDVLPSESGVWQYLESVFYDVADNFGFSEIRVPTFEQTELYQRGVGESSDVVRKEMYTFDDKGGRSMTLRPEITAGVMRAFIQNGMSSLPAPQKFYYNCSCFRYENMQKGRLREFHQFGCELLGAEGPLADVELISLFVVFLENLDLELSEEGGIELRINSIGCPKCRKAYTEKLRAFLQSHDEELCQDCLERMQLNPLRVFDCKVDSCQHILKEAPLLLDNLCEDCQKHFEEVKKNLTALSIPFVVDPYIVRGLDYYTRTVFEFVSTNVGTQGTICGGGRYDPLIAEMGGPDTPGVGWAMGVERLILELESRHMLDEYKEVSAPDIFVVSLPGYETQAYQLVMNLRREYIVAEADLMGRSVKSQTKAADRLKASFITYVGEKEWESQTVVLRQMETGEECEVEIDKIGDFIQSVRLGALDIDFADLLGEEEYPDEIEETEETSFKLYNLGKNRKNQRKNAEGEDEE